MEALKQQLYEFGLKTKGLHTEAINRLGGTTHHNSIRTLKRRPNIPTRPSILTKTTFTSPTTVTKQNKHNTDKNIEQLKELKKWYLLLSTDQQKLINNYNVITELKKKVYIEYSIIYNNIPRSDRAHARHIDAPETLVTATSATRSVAGKKRTKKITKKNRKKK